MKSLQRILLSLVFSVWTASTAGAASTILPTSSPARAPANISSIAPGPNTDSVIPDISLSSDLQGKMSFISILTVHWNAAK